VPLLAGRRPFYGNLTNVRFVLFSASTRPLLTVFARSANYINAGRARGPTTFSVGDARKIFRHSAPPTEHRRSATSTWLQLNTPGKQVYTYGPPLPRTPVGRGVNNDSDEVERSDDGHRSGTSRNTRMIANNNRRFLGMANTSFGE